MSARATRLPDPSIFASGAVARLLDVMNGVGEETRVAGGAVRNAMLGLPPDDIDCATTALPEETMRRAARASGVFLLLDPARQ